MRIIMIGCEYAGKTTLAARVSKWLDENMGRAEFGAYHWHDHFVVPYLANPGPHYEEHAEQVLALAPSFLQMHSLYLIEYHMQMLADDHLLAINWYYGDAVYAPLYYGYGRAGEYGDVRWLARHSDAEVLKAAPDTVLVLMKASPEVIRRRKAENPHPRDIVKDQDVELIVQRFEEEYNLSLLRRKFTIDTTTATVQETFREFMLNLEPHIPSADRLALLTHARMMPTLTEGGK